jgi:hypothetical protein
MRDDGDDHQRADQGSSNDRVTTDRLAWPESRADEQSSRLVDEDL